MEPSSRNYSAQLLAIVAVAFIGVLLLTAAFSYHQVPEGHTGVEKEFGAVTGAQFAAGAHFTAPWKAVQTVECRPRTYTMSDQSGEGEKEIQKDAVVVQAVNGTTHRVDITIRYRVNCANSSGFVSEWNDEEQMEDRLIRPTVRSQLRDEASSIRTSQIYTATGRTKLQQSAQSALTEQFSSQAIILEAVQIREVTLPEGYQKELTKKENSKVKIDRKENQIEVEKKEAERKRVEANADAEVIRIRGDALDNNSIVLRDRYIDAIKSTDKVITSPDQELIIDAQNDTSSSG